MAFDLRTLRLESTLTFDLFIRFADDYVLYRHRDRPFDQRTLATLLSNGVDTLFVRGEAARQLARYFELHLTEILSDRDLPVGERARTVIHVAETLAADILDNPEGRTVRRAVHMVEKLATFALDSPDALSRLIQLLGDGSTLEAHCANTAVLALVLARHAPEATIEALAHLALGGMLHDIGLSLTPSQILQKPGALDRNERLLVQQHPVTGEQILRQVGGMPDEVLRAVRSHHERLDGSGYPDRLRGRSIPWAARVVAIAEAFESLTSTQPYRERMKPAKALRVMLHDMRGQFDAVLLRGFIPALGHRAEDEED